MGLGVEGSYRTHRHPLLFSYTVLHRKHAGGINGQELPEKQPHRRIDYCRKRSFEQQLCHSVTNARRLCVEWAKEFLKQATACLEERGNGDSRNAQGRGLESHKLQAMKELGKLIKLERCKWDIALSDCLLKKCRRGIFTALPPRKKESASPKTRMHCPSNRSGRKNCLVPASELAATVRQEPIRMHVPTMRRK